jgi:hypothetical protein
MSPNGEENQARTDETKKKTAIAVVSGTITNSNSTQKDTTPPKVAPTDSLLNFALSESKKKDEKKRELEE